MTATIFSRKTIKAILGFALLGGFLLWTDVFKNLHYIYNLQVKSIMLVGLLVVISLTLRGLRFYSLIYRHNLYVNVSKCIYTTYASSLLSLVTPGRIGDAGKLVFFNKRKKLIPSIIIEKLLDLSILLVTSSIGLFLFSEYVSIFFIIILLATIIILFASKIDIVLNFIMKRTVLNKGWLIDGVKEFTIKTWSVALFYTIGIWFSGILAQYFLSDSLGIHIPLLLLVQVSSISNMVGLLSGMPGGIGSTQFTFVFLMLQQISVSKEALGVFLAIFIILLYASTIVMGILGLYQIRRLDVQSQSIIK